MDEKALGFNEGQLKRTGFGEAFTPELRLQMERGEPIIRHPFKKEFDGDQVSATLHLKKSATSDYYFLNKFDLELQKLGHAEALKQTFYLTKKPSSNELPVNSGGTQENKYTLKEGYNLLSGRPVYKKLVNQEGEHYQAWVKLNFTNVLNNGSFETKQYHDNYGFDLEKVLGKYSIKELANENYKKSLVESLQRGNMQKVTFLDKEGKEEKLFVSPSITLRALTVYAADKQRLSTDQLIERNYIGNDLAKQLKERTITVELREQQPTQKPQEVKKQRNESKIVKEVSKASRRQRAK